MTKIKYQLYRCTKCKKTDVGKFFEHEHPHVLINCPFCHAGFKMSPQDQMMKREGMVPEGQPQDSREGIE